MPATRVDYVPRPYARSDSTRPDDRSRLADLLRIQGQQTADAHLRRGDIQAQMWANVGNTIGGAINQWSQGKEQKKQQQQELVLKQQQEEANTLNIANAKDERAARVKATEDATALGTALTSDLDPDAIERQLTTGGFAHLVPAFRKSWNDSDTALQTRNKARAAAEEAEADYFGSLAFGVKASGYDPGALRLGFAKAKRDGYEDADGMLQQLEQQPERVQQLVDQLISNSPAQRDQTRKDADLKIRQTSEERQLEALKSTTADRTADNTRAAATAAETVRHNQAMEARPTGQGPQSPIAVIGPDGNPVYVRPSDSIGKRPASTREQGRAVTSGDAGRLSDLTTSLDDVSALRAGLSGLKSTGAVAKIGAKVPNWVTEFTGWGSDPKKKQALIDRVKQVIGKALEEGVLRKEDELKYEKILPTIGDPDDLVISKIDGLETAIKLRRERKLEALQDAGYDTAKFTARSPAQSTGLTAMQLPDGRTKMIPAAQVEEAKRRGAKVIGQ